MGIKVRFENFRLSAVGEIRSNMTVRLIEPEEKIR
jgi:hypothetical protein